MPGSLSVCIRAIVRRGLRANMHFRIGKVELYDVPRTDMVGLLRSEFWLVKDLTLEASKSFKIVHFYQARKWAAMIRVFFRDAIKKEPFINRQYPQNWLHINIINGDLYIAFHLI